MPSNSECWEEALAKSVVGTILLRAIAYHNVWNSLYGIDGETPKTVLVHGIGSKRVSSGAGIGRELADRPSSAAVRAT